MTYEDFIRPNEEEVAETKEADVTSETTVTETPINEPVDEPVDEPEVETSVELEVHKEVVAALAADKAEQNVEIESLRQEKSTLTDEKNRLETTVAEMKKIIGDLRVQLEQVGDLLAKNTERPVSNQISLLDRNLDIEDHFEGETRDHILEVLKEARDASEADGRARRAQLLESVLVANEPCGKLAMRRQELKKLFDDNQNVINGQVINELDKMGIAYKLGENYLLTKEIIKRAY